MVPMHEKDIAGILLGIKAVMLRTDPPFRWASGILSPIYCDNRLLMSYPEKRREVVKAFVDVIRKNNLKFDVVGGVASSGIPHAAWVSDALGKPMVYVRKEAKDHGTGSIVEGRLTKGQVVLMVEDLVSTGGSLVSAIEGVRSAGGVVNDCVAIFTYQLPQADASIRKAGFRLHALSNFPALIEKAVEMKYLKKEELGVVLSWRKDPSGWRKA